MYSKFFNKEKQAEALKWLEEKWSKDKRKCEMCNNENWALADELITQFPFSPSQVQIGGKSFPLMILTCNDCGNTKFINAVVSKVVDTGGNSE